VVRSCIVVECLGGAAGFVCPVVSRKDNPSQKYKVQYPARNEVRESTKVQTCKCTNVQTYKRTNVQKNIKVRMGIRLDPPLLKLTAKK
jgi:hypothetical protein